MPKYLSKSQILSTPGREFADVPCPEWGDDACVRLRSLTSRERDQFEAESLDEDYKTNLDNYRARLAAASVCDEDGELIFSPADANALGEKYGSVLDRLCDKAREISGMNRRDAEASRKNS